MRDFKKYKIKEWGDSHTLKIVSLRKGTVAPSPAELNFYRKYLMLIKEKTKNPALLVLGATPEIRDLGLKMGFRVVAVDMNWGIIRLMDKFLTVKNRDKEIIIKADWLAVPLKENQFDAIIGDVSLNNLISKNIPLLLSIFKRWLKKNSYFLVRNAVMPDHKGDFGTLDRSLDLWRKKKISFREFYFRFRFLHCYPDCYLNKIKAFDAGKEFCWIDKLYKKKFFEAKEYKKLNDIRSIIIHIVLRYTEFLRIFQKNFKVIEISAEVSEKYGFYPVKLFCGKVKK